MLKVKPGDTVEMQGVRFQVRKIKGGRLYLRSKAKNHRGIWSLRPGEDRTVQAVTIRLTRIKGESAWVRMFGPAGSRANLERLARSGADGGRRELYPLPAPST